MLQKKIELLNNKYISMSIQAKASFWYTICNLVQKAISFFVIPIYTRVLTTEEYGKYTVFQSWKDIIFIFATLNLYCGVFTKAMVDHEKDRDRYTSCMQGLSTLITVLLFVVYRLSSPFWNKIWEMDSVTILLMFIYFITGPALSFWSARQRVEYRYKRLVVVTILLAIATPSISLLLLNLSSLREKAVIWGYLAVQILVGGFFYIWNYVKGKVIYVSEYWIHALRFNIPLIPHYLSLIVLGQSDRIMISKFCGDDKAAIYGLAYSVSQLMTIFTSAINNSLTPWMYEKLKNKEYRKIVDISKKLCWLIASMAFVTCLVSPEIVYILGGEDYMEAIWIIPVVSISVYFTFCYGLFSNVEFYYDATQYVMIASVVGAVVNIALNYIFIPIYGFIAAGYTTLACYGLFMIMHYLFMKKTCIKNQIEDSIFDMKSMLLSIIMLLSFMTLCFVLYMNNFVRYGTILVSLIIILINKNKILKLLKKMKL